LEDSTVGFAESYEWEITEKVPRHQPMLDDHVPVKYRQIEERSQRNEEGKWRTKDPKSSRDNKQTVL
jgi:hypothetical protein